MTDDEIEKLQDGDFYHYMFNKDHTHWAKWANRMGRLNLSEDKEHVLATWFANAQMAITDRVHAVYIRARLDAEKAEGN